MLNNIVTLKSGLGHSRSLKLVPFESKRFPIRQSPSIVTMAVSVVVCEIIIIIIIKNVKIRVTLS